MKFHNAVKRIRRLGHDVDVTGERNQTAIASWNGYTLQVDGQEGEVILVHTKRSHLESDSRSDYFPGSFYESLKQAIDRGMGE